MPSIASGITIRLLPITTYTFTGLGTGKMMAIPIAQHLDVTSFTEAHVLFRYHLSGPAAAITTVAAGSLTAGVFADGWDFEDPTSSFFSASALASGAAITATPASAVLQVIPVALSIGSTGALAYGRHLMVQLLASQTTANSTLIAQVSCDIVLKGGDPGGNVGGPNSFMGYRIM